MANIVLKTYAAGENNQGSVTPQNDALIYQAAIPMNGIFSGAVITLSSANVLHVAAGMGIIGGRFFEVLESDISVQLSASGDLLGRLYIHLDLSNADNPIEINAVTGASLPALQGDPDLNVSIGVFDMELCTFDINELTISNIVQTFPTITAANNQIRRATAYSVNDFALCQSASNALVFVCTTAGTTAVQQPMGYATITDGNTITDGTAVFKAVGLMAEITRNQQLIAPVLTSLVAPTGGLSTGEQFIYNGLLYKATADISEGSTIVINGNAELADCVTEQIRTLSTDYVVVAESGAINESFADKLTKLQTAFNSLSNKQKIKSFLLLGDISTYYHVSGSKYFQSDVTSTQSSGNDTMTFTIMTISTATRHRASITGTSSKFDNTSSSTSASSLALCYWK